MGRFAVGAGARRARKGLAGVTAGLVTLGLLQGALAPLASAAPVGQGFTVSPADLAFILKQIKIAERHAGQPRDNFLDPNCDVLVGPAADQVPTPLISFGLRTVDGSCNNLQPSQERYGASDQVFPRLATPVFKDAEPRTFDPDGPGPEVPGQSTSYVQKAGSVFDSQPRTVSNLIVDQTANNPAAVAAAGYPVRTQGNEGVFPCSGIGEVQTITGTASGAFSIVYDGAQTASIPAGASAGQIEAALVALPNLDAGDVSVSGVLATGVALRFRPALGDVTQVTLAQGVTGLTVATTTQGTPGTQEVVSLTGPAGAPYHLIFGGQPTAELAETATAADIQAALNAAPVNAGVTVTDGGSPDEFTITFTAVGDATDITTDGGQTVTVTTAGAQGGAEEQTLSGTANGPFTLDVDGDVTGPIAANASASTIAAAINAAAGSTLVAATGGPLPAVVTITFLGGGDVPPISVPGSAAASGLTLGNPKQGVLPDTPGCGAGNDTLFIPNVTTDIGLSPPFNSWFTIFGQFFDHGLDKVTNGGTGTVFVPLKADDPLRTVGPDGVAGTGDEVPPSKAFMPLTRATIKPGTDHDGFNTDTPFVDQSQTYTSHASHQVFTREYVQSATPLRTATVTRKQVAGNVARLTFGPQAHGFKRGQTVTVSGVGAPFDGSQMITAATSSTIEFAVTSANVADGPSAGTAVAPNGPLATGKFLASPDGGLPNWAEVKAQASEVLGIRLTDHDVTNIPLIATDQYGNFVPGPNGRPQLVTIDVDGADNDLGTDCGTPTASAACADNNAEVLREGDPAANGGEGVDLTGAVRIGTAFLNDIAHSASPFDDFGQPRDPDANGTAGGSLSPTSPTGSYDDELLDEHFIAGDGRVNENIALTAVHQIFHSEHDRLIDDIKQTLTTDTSRVTNVDDWQLAGTGTPWNGERLFQAARFVTEMEYQHLVFEEFARKVQPAINPFEPFAFNQTDVNPAITAEFAHAVYRFGHSMLTETIARTNENGVPNDIDLLDGFLNPVAYHDGGLAGPLTSQQAAGSIVMGLSDQAGNEIDEFTTNVLRNNLLGLPLDLPAINMTRARSEGIPSLNDLRKEIYASTNDGQLAPYPSWAEFGQGLKHPESLVNFVAAYGRHPTILFATGGADNNFATTADNEPATLASRRAAARAIVAPEGDVPPIDAEEFMFSQGAWANTPSGASRTGLDDVDLWVGGLAENTNPFGGLLGPTFNYVFENQLTNLQNGDRFYYLARTPGMNLRAQLEGNSFAEMIMRNTTAHSLKADSFATADCKFQLGNLTFPAAAGSAIVGAGSVQDDPKSECDENLLLLRSPDGQFRYRSTNAVDPPGINGQSVYNGTAGTDRVFGGNDNDTFLGNDGNDRIEGGAGDDIALGGKGNDIITDISGADVPKGGPGNDAIDGGIGDDIIMAGDGDDFTNGGANLNEHFLGAGDDFAIAGQGLDAVFGDSGDDWVEGGDMPDLLIGDSSTLFFTDHNEPGHDVTIGQGGDDDYDTEGGDDIMVAGPGVEKNAGASGYDWSIGLRDPQPQVVDLDLRILPEGQPAIEVRDRFNEVEAASGYDFDDSIKGDSTIPSQTGGGGFIGCDALDQSGLDRIAGLDAIVPPLTVPSGPIKAATTTNFCALKDNVWGEGNILLGGRGNDLLEGRGGDDILDGDRYLNVRILVRDAAGNEIGTAELGAGQSAMTSKIRLIINDTLTPYTLQEAVFNGSIDPGNLSIVREIVTPTATTNNFDVAVFSDSQANYTVTENADGSLTVAHTGGTQADGTDIIRNVERLTFADGVRNIGAAQNTPATGVLTISDTTPEERQALTVALTDLVDADGLPAPESVSFTWEAEDKPGEWVSVGLGTSFTPGATEVELPLRVRVMFLDGANQLETFTSPATDAVANVPDPATGAPTIDNTTPSQGQLLTASTVGIADLDGLDGAVFAFQWEQLVGVDWTPIVGATNPTFTPGDQQVGRQLRVVVSFVDHLGGAESLTSAATDVVGSTVTGTAAANTLIGTAGADVVVPLGGNDTINLLAGADTVRFAGAAGGFDAVNGGLGQDRLTATATNTVIGLRSLTSVESITGGGFSGVVVNGSSGANAFDLTNTTLSGIVRIDMGAGDDTVLGSDGPDVLLGGDGNDTLRGRGGNDNVRGNAGADKLYGGSGADRFTGGSGADSIETGSEADVVVLAPGSGSDKVKDFDATAAGGQDLIDVSQLGVKSSNFSAKVKITKVTGGTLVTIGTSKVTLVGVAKSSVTKADFILG